MIYSQAQIGAAGERVVDRWLASRGYTTNFNTRQPGSTDIEAAGTRISLLMQVKTAMSPSTPVDLSSDEVRSISSRAARIGYQAWQAKVTVDTNRVSLVRFNGKNLMPSNEFGRTLVGENALAPDAIYV